MQVVTAEKIDISLIVSAINSGRHDYAIYDKRKRTVEDIESELPQWLKATNVNSQATAYLRIDHISWNNRLIKYTIIPVHQSERKVVTGVLLRYLFDKFNVNKITSDIIYDRTEVIREYVALGAKIELRKRQHILVDGKLLNVAELAIFRKDLVHE